MASAESDVTAHVQSMPTDGIRHNCGLAAFYFNEPAPLSYLIGPLQRLNHRGQEGVGVVGVRNDGTMVAHRSEGLVRDNINDIIRADTRVTIAIGHDRYSTSGGLKAWQPFGTKTDNIVTAHNGNLTNPLSLLHYIPPHKRKVLVSDTHTLHKALNTHPERNLEERLQTILPRAEGAFSLIVADRRKHALYLIRDPWGFRPLHYAALDNGNGYIAASETSAFHQFARDNNNIIEVMPGQCLRIDTSGVTEITINFPKVPIAQCIFELVYLGYPVSKIFEVPAAEFRRHCGASLAHIDIKKGFVPDLIVPIRDSGTQAAEGYAEAMISYLAEKGYSHVEIAKRIPREAVYRSNYNGRTFILPSARDSAVEQKFMVDPYVIDGKHIAVIDDSVVRGTTMKRLVKMLREGGAASVHVRSASPPIRHGCFYGVDFTGKNGELVAAEKNTREIANIIGTDSIRYLSLSRMVAIAQRLAPRKNSFCTACFSGKYPVKVDQKLMLNKVCL